MSDEKFLLEYEKLLDKGYCNCNEMNCIDNNSPRRILNIAKTLQKENEDLKKQLEKKYEKLGTLTAEILYEENTRLANEITVLKTENQKSKEMQREFIDWLGSLVVSNLDVFTEIKVCDVLSKYKEITGE